MCGQQLGRTNDSASNTFFFGGNHQKMNLPSGKLSHNYGKSPFLMGKLTINGNFQ
jgi:hypothetical protein